MADLDLSGRTLGEFVLCERIGAGGHGTVYRCEQRALGRDAVVKVLRPRRKDDAEAARFVREAQLASRLDHPYSAHVYAFGVEDDGVRWIAMELIHGVTLGAWLKERGPMSLAQFVPLFEHVAEVVHAAHGRGIVHRDLKPSNIMVAEIGGRLLPKLLDFGIAKLFDAPDSSDEEHCNRAATTARLRNAPPSERTRTSSDPESMRLTPRGAVLGSAPYMSPEQWCDPWSVGFATDIYALGCLAHEALAGRTPFVADSAPAYCDLHLRAEPPALAGEFPAGVDKAIRRALDKSPQARQRSALELAAELRAALRAEPHEQLRSAAQQWEDRARSPGFLWGADGLLEVGRSVPPDVMNELECSFVAAITRRARRLRWTKRALAVLAVLGAIVALEGRLAMRARLAETEARAARNLAEAKVTESERERGRAALLHGEPEALPHLSEAYKRDHSRSTAFMLARAMQPRLSELARLPGTYGRTWCATFSPDGSQLATADDRAAQIWDGKTYRLLFTLPHGAEVYQTAYTPDGAMLVTVTETSIRVWNARTGTLVRILGAKPGDPKPPDYFALAVSPDGRLVAAADSAGSSVRIWDATSGASVAELHEGPTSLAFPRLAFSADGWLATSGGGEARIFDVRTWRQAFVVPGPVRSLAFDARGRLVTGTAMGEVALWDVRGASRLRQLRPFGEPVEAVTFSADGALVAAGSGDGAIQSWRTDSGALQSQLNPRHGKIVGIEFAPSAERLVAANADGTVVIADVKQGLTLAVLDGPSNALRTAHFAPDGLRVVGASWDGTARVWDAASPYRRWSSAPIGEVCNVGGGSPDRRFVGVACRGLPTRVWDTANDTLLAELPSTTAVRAGDYLPAPLAVSEGGDRAAIAQGEVADVYELPGGRLLRRVRHGVRVTAVAFAGAGRDLVTGAADGSVLVTR
ncbi:MAG: protein kinase, partial [Kofleriaceae bacterium]